ncbi:TauD/TfdA dioxygenase family protein [Zavarzinia compransoris]|nr:TauD/TfdA family dioxygenase [Zavarzinia compransoris]TDP44247.1 taurine dioxygenase [Zavarzinia compransoris]
MTAATVYNHITVTPVGGTFGARVEGIDIARPIADAAWAEVARAFAEHRVIVLPDQPALPDRIIDLSRRIGFTETHIDGSHLLDGYPEIIQIGNLKVDGVMKSLFVNAREEWHFDYSYVEKPSIAALFYAVAVPPEGGDTLFADSTAAFEALPEAEKDYLRGLTAVHSWARLHEQLEAMDPTRKPLSAAAKQKYAPVPQPLVYRHPVTGRESLWVAAQVVSEIPGLAEAETRALLDRLTAHVTQPEFVYRHQWRQGDLVFFDNRATLHTATIFDYERYLRLMYRTTILDRAA